METLQTHQVDINMFDLDITSIRELPPFVQKSNYYRFETQIYHQVDGVAMRDILAQSFAIILMHALECYCEDLAMQASSLQGIPRQYPHHGTENVAEFVGHFNNGHTNIKFTFETSEEKQRVNYMDVTLQITTSSDISYQLFHKACNSGRLIEFHSAVPGHVKAAVSTSQFRRAKHLSSHIMRKASEANICQQLRTNPYPEVFINEAKKQCQKKL